MDLDPIFMKCAYKRLRGFILHLARCVPARASIQEVKDYGLAVEEQARLRLEVEALWGIHGCNAGWQWPRPSAAHFARVDNRRYDVNHLLGNSIQDALRCLRTCVPPANAQFAQDTTSGIFNA